jgi:hypothetical protein
MKTLDSSHANLKEVVLTFLQILRLIFIDFYKYQDSAKRCSRKIRAFLRCGDNFPDFEFLEAAVELLSCQPLRDSFFPRQELLD